MEGIQIGTLLRNKNIAQKCRSEAYEASVRSVMLYGSETWAISNRVESNLRSCDRRMMRYMARVKRKTYIEGNAERYS